MFYRVDGLKADPPVTEARVMVYHHVGGLKIQSADPPRHAVFFCRLDSL